MRIQCFETYTPKAAYYVAISDVQYYHEEDRLEEIFHTEAFTKQEVATILPFFTGYRCQDRLEDYYLDFRGDRWCVTLMKSEQEYYYLRQYQPFERQDTFYRCDQLAGLVEWLQDMENKLQGYEN